MAHLNDRGLWLPVEVYREKQGIGIWARALPRHIGVQNGEKNFGRDEAWDPGTGETCDFPTSSLGLQNVDDGETTKNNNCYAINYALGEYTHGESKKTVGYYTAAPTLSPGGFTHVTLSRPENFGTQNYAMCDAWDAKDQQGNKRGLYQSLVYENLDVAGAPAEDDFFTVTIDGEEVPADAGIWHVEYAASDISVAGGRTDTEELLSLQSAVDARCTAESGWVTDPSELGADSINTMRVVFDRDALTQHLADKGIKGAENYEPAVNVKFWVQAADSDDVPAEDDTENRSFDHYANVYLGEDEPHSEFVQFKWFNVDGPSSSLSIDKTVAAGSGIFQNSDQTTPGDTVAYLVRPEGTISRRTTDTPNEFIVTVEDELPRCMDGEPLEIEQRSINDALH